MHHWPAMQEIRWSYSWGNSEQMGQAIRDLYPNGIPRFIIQGVLSYSDGVNHAITERMKEHDKS